MSRTNNSDRIDSIPAAVTVWLLDASAVTSARLNQLAAALGPSEQQRLTRFTRPQRARQFLLGRLLLRHALRQTLTIDQHQICITERAGAAPLLELRGLPPSRTMPFSLSHSGDWIACALGQEGALGIDIEVRDAPRDLPALASAAFEPQQQAWLQQQPETQQAAAFYRLWNCQEALYKLGPAAHASGTNCCILPHPQLAICLCSGQPIDTLAVHQIVKM